MNELGISSSNGDGSLPAEQMSGDAACHERPQKRSIPSQQGSGGELVSVAKTDLAPGAAANLGLKLEPVHGDKEYKREDELLPSPYLHHVSSSRHSTEESPGSR